MRTAYKCRAYPNPEQAAALSRTFGCVRLVWNKTLSERIRRYKTENNGTSYRETDATLTNWKRSDVLGFLSEVSCVPLQQTLRHQHSAFQNFFSRRSRYPRFKSRTGRQSAHYTRSAFRMRGGSLTLAKMSTPVPFTWPFTGVDVGELSPTTVIVSREPDGRWYVSFAVDVRDPAAARPANREIGLDLGLRNFMTTSDGTRVPRPRNVDRKARNLARYQRRMARCQRGSNNRLKAKAKVARAYRKVRNTRQDFLHRTSTALVRSADMISVEDLNVAGMIRNRRLARVISDTGWGEFRRQLEYKCQRAGRTLVVIDRWYPSTKKCSVCGRLLTELKLCTRHWSCAGCRTRHDRDLNAAKNILAAGRAVARGSSGDACGADVRRQGSSLPRSAVNQEAHAETLGS